MSNNLRLMLVGAGYMGKEYCRVLKDQDVSFSVVCRSEKTADAFEAEMGVRPLTGGLEAILMESGNAPDAAIVAVNVEQLAQCTIDLLRHGVRKILVEKPAGVNREEIQKVYDAATAARAEVYVAYNRRFYASTEKAMEIIAEDGGVSSLNFEFTEWGFKIEKTKHSPRVKEEWLLANSSHIVDLAFFLGGFPEEMHSYMAGSLSWHSRASKYSGAGITDKGALFSYQANWDAPGRWAVEILTKEHRLYFKPIEKLQIQNKGSVAVEDVEIDDSLDVRYKPGLYKQVRAFLGDVDDCRKVSIGDQLKHLDYIEMIEGII